MSHDGSDGAPARDGAGLERFHMIDVGETPATRRRALARGRIQMSAGPLSRRRVTE